MSVAKVLLLGQDPAAWAEAASQCAMVGMRSSDLEDVAWTWARRKVDIPIDVLIQLWTDDGIVASTGEDGE